MNENELLSRLPPLFRSDDPSVLIGSGPDDCAHVRFGTNAGILSVSTDAFAEGSHFLPDTDPRDIARKSLAAALSDLAASACRPLWAVLSLCLRPGLRPNWIEDFADELAATARRYGITIIGGDTISSQNGLFVSVTVMGAPLPGGPILRGGARPGDVLVVTGELGGSLLGKHLNPTPRLTEIGILMEFCSRLQYNPSTPTAVMDISDGLAIDLSRLCRESGVGAVLEEERIPVAPQAREMSGKTGKSALEHALSDGEDFELLIAMNPLTWQDFSEFLQKLPDGENELAPFTRIGMVTTEKALLVKDGDGNLQPLEAKGYEHTW